MPFVFLCFNEVLYIYRKSRQPVFKGIRICDITSFVIALVLMIVACFVENWIFYNIMAGCICVGSIKIFHFRSLKQAFYSMGIMCATVTIVAIILHYLLERSYNDYTSELASPLFIQIPDLVSNIFKKCSWLPTFDVIIPGVMLSYLRVYD
jgi:hypothetical protein